MGMLRKWQMGFKNCGIMQLGSHREMGVGSFTHQLRQGRSVAHAGCHLALRILGKQKRRIFFEHEFGPNVDQETKVAVHFPVKGKESLDKAPEPEILPAGVGSNSVVLLITLTTASWVLCQWIYLLEGALGGC